MPTKQPNVIQVRIWDKLVGAVAPDHRAGLYAFQYAPAWIKRKIELSPLQMPLSKHPYSFPNIARITYKGLPGLLADCLPDDFGNALIDAWMARRGMDKDSITSLDRLAYMGKRGMGALEFRPSTGSHRESQAALKMAELVRVARDVVHGNIGDEYAAETALTNIIRVGTSAGGARPKAVVAWNRATNELRSGQFDCPAPFEHWLIKFDGIGAGAELGASSADGRIEYAYYKMATAAGIEMSECRLLHENGRHHFMTKRFDRDNNDKHHIQSLCGLNHLDYKQRQTNAYEQLFSAIERLQLNAKDKEQAFRRMVFNCASKNCDDHAKNHGFRLRMGASWELAPAYDITYAYAPNNPWTHQHLMSVNGKFKDITRSDLLTVAQTYNIPGATQVINDVNNAIDAWGGYAKDAGVPQENITLIGIHHVKL